MVVAFGYYIWKQNQYIQKELDENIDTSFNRMEGIIIELINQQKLTQMELAEIKGYIAGIESILQRLTGNGLKPK